MAYTLITGASGGIGLELAKVFAKEGHALVLVARNEKKLLALQEKLAKLHGIKIEVITSDLSKKDAALDVYRRTKEKGIVVDHLVNNAGFGDYAEFLDADWNRQYEMVQLNLLALMQLTYLYGNDMRNAGFGRILNLSSVAAFSAGPYMSVYYATKGFVLSFSQAVNEELKGTGVTVTALCPGPTSSGFEKNAQMKNSKMFTFVGSAKAEDVATYGYKAMKKGKAYAYHGLPTKLLNIGSRIGTRNIATKFAGIINGIPM